MTHTYLRVTLLLFYNRDGNRDGQSPESARMDTIMKSLLTYTFAACLLLAATSCKDENLETGQDKSALTFNAIIQDYKSKTAIDGEGMLWSKGDMISIFDGTGNNRFTLKDGAGSSTATFSGEAKPDATYYGLYPYSEEAGCVSGTITSFLPPEQNSDTDGTFSTMTSPAVAECDGSTLTFKNITALVRVNVANLPSDMKIKSIQLSAAQGMTGEYTVNAFDSAPSAKASGDQKTGVRLYDKDGGTLADGPYYLCVLPRAYTDIDIIVKFSDSRHIIQEVSKYSSLRAGEILNVDIDAGDAVESPESDLFQDFTEQNEDNILLDFSYAGYMHGETAPEEVTVTENADGSCTASNGYKVYNIENYGADGSDDISDRQAFIDMLTDVFGAPKNGGEFGTQITFADTKSARAILYFPEGNFILHTADDDTPEGKSHSIIIRSGDLILKGAGRDKTIISMNAPNQPDSEQLYSSPDMIQIKHNTGVLYNSPLANVTENAEKGSFSVKVDNAGSLKEGQWICLYMQNNSPDVVAAEMAPYSADPSWVITSSTGVSVNDYHQIKAVDGNTVTFHEPLMHAVDAGWGWSILGFEHYENVGIEDLTFAGHSKDDFIHHASWHDDGAYKLISVNRLTNSWMRRVRFNSVSECCSIIGSANVSVYDVLIEGNRGHAAIRSQGSSRVFLGAILDYAEGLDLDESGKHIQGSTMEWTGQYHAVGVSKQSMGAVLWRNVWGNDSNFESHATQPRATLIDCCTGGWNMLRAGGDKAQLPNHLADLTIWNFNSTTPYSGTWVWWDDSSDWWKFLPPIIAGFHGAETAFDQNQVITDYSHGIPVSPESLYEAQLEHRLGYVPGWLQQLK